MLADVESLPPKAVDKLEDYVAAGGSAFFFLGGRVDASFYNDNLIGTGRRDGGLLPGRLVQRQGDPAAGKDIAFVSDVDYDHPALAPSATPASRRSSGRRSLSRPCGRWTSSRRRRC